MTERLWFKIGETARQVGATPKELRYWEKVIPELRPRRSKGNLRYYHVDEFPRLQKIHDWLAEGLTVADCRQLLMTGHLARPLLALEEEPAAEPTPPARARRSAAPRVEIASNPDLKPVLKALKALAKRLAAPPPGAPAPKRELDPEGLWP